MVQPIAANKEARTELDVLLKQAILPEPLSPQERRRYRQRIHALLRREDAVLIAHYYTDPELQDLAEESGGCVADSLEMARFGSRHSASTLVVLGVRFMGETAAILSPRKRVLMPTLDATCSLDVGCPPAAFAEFCQAHPERSVVVYANTSAAVKALADWVVTSSIALDVVEHLDAQGEKILWAPDKYLGDYVRRCTGADLLSWEGSCVVHEEFKARGILDLKQVCPEAVVLAHPEAPPSVLNIADRIGSTSQIIRFAREMPAQKFIVATDKGLFHKLQQQLPDKVFFIAPTAGEGATCRSCAHCPWMAMNSLDSLTHSLETGANRIRVSADLAKRALQPLQRMLDFSHESATISS